MRLALVLVLIGCSKADQPPKGTQTEARGALEHQRAKTPPTTKPSPDIPDWVPLDHLDGAPTKPTAWKADGRPTLVVFSASWCPGCTASALADRALVRAHGKDLQIGIALQESDEEFVASPYARALSGVPVWSEASTAKLTKACDAVAIPSACLFVRGKPVWTGEVSEASAVVEANRAGKLAEWHASADAANEAAQQKTDEALRDPNKIPELLAIMHGHADWENSVAWRLVDRDNPSRNAVALAVALSRDAVVSDGGIDFAHLDTYALALAQAGRAADAAYVGARVIAVCSAVNGKCPEEKRRALEFIESARTQ